MGKPGLFTRELYYPFIDTLMYALPYTLRNVEADAGTSVSVQITSEVGGTWTVVKLVEGWLLNRQFNGNADAAVKIDPDTAWKLFTKSKRPADVQHLVEINGNEQLASLVLNMVAVMA